MEKLTSYSLIKGVNW